MSEEPAVSIFRVGDVRSRVCTFYQIPKHFIPEDSIHWISLSHSWLILDCFNLYLEVRNSNLNADTDLVFAIIRRQAWTCWSISFLAVGYRWPFFWDKAPNNAEFKNVWSYNSSLPYVFLAWCFSFYYRFV